jgi:hypothetical protein
VISACATEVVLFFKLGRNEVFGNVVSFLSKVTIAWVYDKIPFPAGDKYQ